MNCLVLGAGAWGTAMALHLHRCGHAVTLAPRRLEHALELASSRENSDYLPGYRLPYSIQIGSEITPLLMEAEGVFFACPSYALRETARAVANSLDGAWRLRFAITLCKGVEAKTFKLPSAVVHEELPQLAVGALSGPAFAHEVAEGLPTALALGYDGEDGEALQAAFSNQSLRTYRTDDVVGVELGATLKNVYAIGAGLCDGLRLGHNAKAAFITRSLKEMVVLGTHLGGREETFFGLSGFGDLVVTCHGPKSRNRTLGEEIGQGATAAAVLKTRKTVTEGAAACAHLAELCQRESIDAPILLATAAILAGKMEARAALSSLMARELKPEFRA